MNAIVAVIVGLVIGIPAMFLFVVLGLAIGALDAYVIWKGWMWHAVPAGLPSISFAVVWAAKVAFGLWMAPLRPKKDGDVLDEIIGRPIGAVIVLAVLAWLR